MYALQQLGIFIREYHTYEILPEAIAVSQYHFPFVVHHGDLYEADFEQFKGFDLLLAGTCCQSLSRVRIESKEVNNGLDGKSADEIGKTHVAEGVVVRIDNRATFTAYKDKVFEFKVIEGIAKDTSDVPDMEEAEELFEETLNE